MSLGSSKPNEETSIYCLGSKYICNETYVYMLEYSFDNIPMLLSSLPNPLQPVTQTPEWILQGNFHQQTIYWQAILAEINLSSEVHNWPSTDCRSCASSTLNMGDTNSSVQLSPCYTISMRHSCLQMSRVAKCPSQTEWVTPALFASVTRKFTNEMDDLRHLILYSSFTTLMILMSL